MLKLSNLIILYFLFLCYYVIIKNTISTCTETSNMVINMRKKIIIILLVLSVALYVSRNFYQLNLIQGESMAPAYQNMQFTIIDRRAADFQYGDVVVFYCPALRCTMVKRIIALPGDTVWITDGSVLVNDIPSTQVSGNVAFDGIASQKLTLGNDEFFVMGDNHALSKDSRYAKIGCVRRKNMIGRLIPNRPAVTTVKPHS